MGDEPIPSDLRELISQLSDLALEKSPAGLVELRETVHRLARSELSEVERMKLLVDSEDLAQDALLHLVKHVHYFRGTSWQEFFAFVRTILTRQKIDLARHFGRQKREEDRLELASRVSERAPPTPSQIFSGKEDHQRLRKLIEELPDSLRVPLELRLSGKSYEETAHESGTSPASARQRVSRALRQLRDRWKLPLSGEETGRPSSPWDEVQ